MSNRGRPTKYKGEETVKAVQSLIDTMTMEQFFKCCGIEHIALAIGITRETVYEWCKEYPDFSDTIKRFVTKRNALFLSLCASPQIKDARWIFLAKNWLGMTDKQEVEHTGDFLPLKVIVKSDKEGNGAKTD